MITGEIKNRIDTIWDAFWTGGITNSISILEQMTYLFFMKMLDDAQKTKEANASLMGVEIKEPTFKTGMWHNPDTDKDVPYDSLRWSVFKNKEAEEMYRLISRDVFAFIKNLNTGKESAYSRFMANATFMIQNPRTLVKIVEGIDSLDMNNRDTMGDVYEYVLGKMAASGNNGQFRTPRHIIRMMVEATDMRSAVRTPFLARSSLPMPRFCPTNVVEASATDCMGRRISWSILEYAVQPPMAYLSK